MAEAAICQRCGGRRDGFEQICPACGHRPQGEGLMIAWLLSSHNLDEAKLEAAAQRISGGEPLRPSGRQLERARRALGQDYRTDPGLTVGQRLALLGTSIVLTPMVGWAAWLWWRQTRPRASLQALALALPLTVIYTFAWPAFYLFR